MNKAEFLKRLTDKDTNRVTDKVINEVTDNQQAILKLISENKNISANEMASIIKISKRKVLQNILNLKQNGFIERVGNNRIGYWKILK